MQQTQGQKVRQPVEETDAKQPSNNSKQLGKNIRERNNELPMKTQ